MLVGVGLMWWSWQLIGDSAFRWTVPFLVVSNLWGLCTVIVSWMPDAVWSRESRAIQVLKWGTVFLTVAVFIAWAVNAVGGMSPYGTDAMAFNQYAAQIADTRGQPVRPFDETRIRPVPDTDAYYTYGFTGQPVTALSYPALSPLIYMPFLLIGWSQNLAPLINVFSWGSRSC